MPRPQVAVEPIESMVTLRVKLYLEGFGHSVYGVSLWLNFLFPTWSRSGVGHGYIDTFQLLHQHIKQPKF